MRIARRFGVKISRPAGMASRGEPARPASAAACPILNRFC
jgi:hypothetical protein